MKEFLVYGIKVVMNHFGAKIFTDDPDTYRRVCDWLYREGMMQKDSCGVFKIFKQ